MISRFTLAVWGIPKDSVQDMKIVQEYITKLLPSNAFTNSSTSSDDVIIYYRQSIGEYKVWAAISKCQ